MPGTAGGHYSMGYEVLRNPAEETARLTEVALVGAENVQLVEAVVMDIVDRTTVGLQEWPPGTVEGTQEWSARVASDGAIVPPGDEKSLVLHLRPSTVPASLAAVRIRYELDGKDYEYETATSLQIKDKCF